MLTVQELTKAENMIIANCQRQAFPEFLMLQEEKGVKSSSDIRKLNAYLDDGILRVGGRLSRACMLEG